MNWFRKTRGPRPPGQSTLLKVFSYLLLNILVFSSFGFAQKCLVSTEPDDSSANASIIESRACVVGDIEPSNQDLILWTLTDDDARFYWNIELKGPQAETKLELFRVTLDDQSRVTGSESIFILESERGLTKSQDLILAAGTYLLGVVSAGQGEYYINLEQASSLTHATAKRHLPGNLDNEPNDSTEDARERQGTFELLGDLAGSADYYRWTLSEEDATQLWELKGQVMPAGILTLKLFSSTGEQVATATSEGGDRFVLGSLGLTADTYTVVLGPASELANPYTLEARAVGVPTEGQEIEPNNIEEANIWNPATPMQGDLDIQGTDYFRITFEPSNVTRSIQLETASEAAIDMCLFTEQQDKMKCDRARQLENLHLSGTYILSVSPVGRQEELLPYTLSLINESEPEADFETEPNDRLEDAFILGESLRARGSFIGSEADVFKFVVEGEPQLWRVQAVGENLRSITLSTERVELQSRSAEERRLRLDNLLLNPGTYFLTLRGEDSEYALRAIPLGPAEASAELIAAPESLQEESNTSDFASTITGPGPDGLSELEPNDKDNTANRLRFDSPRFGLLTRQDTDVYRFYLAAEHYVRIELIPPEDAELRFTLNSEPRVKRLEPNSTVIYEGLLLPGDHHIYLQSSTDAEGFYQLRLTQLDPLALPADLEPNDRAEQARPLPANLVINGSVGQYNDEDWFELPRFEQNTAVTLTAQGDFRERDLSFVQGDEVLAFDYNSETKTYQGIVPAHQIVNLRVRGETIYDLSFAFEQVTPGSASDISVSLSTKTENIAAYWHEGQQIKLSVNVQNNSSETQEIELLASSSDLTWHPVVGETSISLHTGEQKDIPIAVNVLPFARDDQPVLLSFATKDQHGFIQSDSVQVQPICTAPPVNETQVWSVPDALLGGMNVAWQGFGSVALGDHRYDPAINDGLVTSADGAFRQLGESITLDLAGDEPVTLLGTLLHPQASVRRESQLREFDILVSMDGENFTKVYTGELDAAKVEQAFVFDEPVEARFSRMILKSNYSFGTRTDVGVGEWKLIAPGNTFSEGQNLTDLNLGGYVVYSEPFAGSACCKDLIVSDEEDGQFQDKAETYNWVLGFHHNRAAQITRLEWIDGESRPENRFQEVEVSISLDSPAGPWEPLGIWTLERSNNGVIPFDLAAATWARFVLFEAKGLESGNVANVPQRINIIERTTDDNYTSILAEWGMNERNAIYEFLSPPQQNAITQEDDQNDTPDSAQLLPLGKELSGRVLVEEDVDWLRIDVPEGANLLNLTLRGSPAIDYVYKLQDASGNTLEAEIKELDDEIFITANVQSGSYFLKIEEPPRSVIFSWDTSGSVGNFYDVIDQTMMRFARDVKEGREEVNLLPFNDGPLEFLLRDWSGDASEVTTAVVNSDRREGSSNSETALITSSLGMQERIGTKAIMFITDAETDGYLYTPAVWQALREVQPRIFSFEISSRGSPYAQDLLQSWADVNQGDYEQAADTGDLEIGFSKAICILRRPKTYHVTAEVDVVELKGPGFLRVKQEYGETAPEAVPGAAVEVILDASGSMYKTLEGRFRYEIAKDVLDDLVARTLPNDIPFALRVFGNREESSCRTDLEVALAPLNRDAVRTVIAGVEPQPFAFTPIADSLLQVANDLATVDGTKTVILITDGEESCDGNVEASIQALKDQGIDVQLNVIGFDFDADDKEAAREQFRAWAELGNGQYFDANSAEELELSLEQAVSTPPPFEVLDTDGNRIATGIVNGEFIELPQGSYSVKILAAETLTIQDVMIESEAFREIDLGN